MSPPRDRRPLVERWRPVRLSEIVGNRRAIGELSAWADSWESGGPPPRRAALLVGPPGVGKTTAAGALAAERGWSLVEMNASEARNQGAIERIAGRASLTHPLDRSGTGPDRARTLVLLDEADCLSGGRATEAPRPAREPMPLRSFLEGRYGTVAALNTAWGLTGEGKIRPFAGWAAFPRTPGNSAWAKLPAARRDLDDWRAVDRTEDAGDRGGLAAIARLVRSTRQPLVLTVNDDRPLQRYSPVFRSAARTIPFGPVAPADVVARLRAVAAGERFELGRGVVDAITARAQGDLRAALNDLEAIAPLPAGPAQLEVLGTRDLPSDFAGLTEEVLQRPRYYRSVEVRDRLDAPPDDLLPWIEENVPWFAPDDRHRDAGLAVVAVAELFLARARRWRAYGLWSYASELLTGGVSLALREVPSSGRERAAFPRFLAEMGRSRASRAVRDGLARKLGRHLHFSRAKSRAIALPFVEGLLARAGAAPARPEVRSVARALVAELELTPEELAALLGVDPASPDVRALLPADGNSEPDAAESASPSPPARPAGARAPVQRQLGDWGRG